VNVAVGVAVDVGVRVGVGVRVSVAVGVGVSVGVGTVSAPPQLPEAKMTARTTTTPRMPPTTGTRTKGFVSLANAVYAPLFCEWYPITAPVYPTLGELQAAPDNWPA